MAHFFRILPIAFDYSFQKIRSQFVCLKNFHNTFIKIYIFIDH